jgi:hypothetical protein
MKHRNVYLSPIGIVLLVALFAFLGYSLWYDGGLLFTPGAVSAKSLSGVALNGFVSHADFEKACSLCHRPLKTDQGTLCLTCHTDIQDEMTNQIGLHSHIDVVENCATCHLDHRGREFNPTVDSLGHFDHTLTVFSLTKHQVNFDMSLIECDACHNFKQGFKVANQVCEDCHSQKAEFDILRHAVDYGENCLSCHDGVDRMKTFDHSQTAYKLEGQHIQVGCSTCHKDGQTKGTPSTCQECHSEPGIHTGQYSNNCADCHTPQDWQNVTLDNQPFNHSNQTRFSLAHHEFDFAGTPVTCLGCHPNGTQTSDPSICITCHTDHDPAFMVKHDQQYGATCLNCHDGVDRLAKFDHAVVYPLQGRHAEIECAACHPNKSYRGTSTACVDCHLEPQIHAGFFGLQCQDCHSTIAWAPADLRIHTFPLTHGDQGEIACIVCHTSKYVEYTCYGCHNHQVNPNIESHSVAGIALQDLPDCVRCHETGLKNETIRSELSK